MYEELDIALRPSDGRKGQRLRRPAQIVFDKAKHLGDHITMHLCVAHDAFLAYAVSSRLKLRLDKRNKRT